MLQAKCSSSSYGRQTTERHLSSGSSAVKVAVLSGAQSANATTLRFGSRPDSVRGWRHGRGTGQALAREAGSPRGSVNVGGPKEDMWTRASARSMRPSTSVGQDS